MSHVFNHCDGFYFATVIAEFCSSVCKRNPAIHDDIYNIINV